MLSSFLAIKNNLLWEETEATIKTESKITRKWLILSPLNITKFQKVARKAFFFFPLERFYMWN